MKQVLFKLCSKCALKLYTREREWERDYMMEFKLTYLASKAFLEQSVVFFNKLCLWLCVASYITGNEDSCGLKEFHHSTGLLSFYIQQKSVKKISHMTSGQD